MHENMQSTDFQQRYENTHWEKENLFKKWCWKNGISTSRRVKLDPYISTHINFNLKYIKGSNVKVATMKLLEE
jgi:hypothetical protein